ncbi:DUF7096 domain-containing protein [Halomicrococcus sp. SG-WS-1]|uniref:DUF7096 domain-containing protein n=1 Tax=Halomicrococcus sp. SG-WS-1 TaxID=3439057 RepID=UPI003F7ACFA4
MNSARAVLLAAIAICGAFVAAVPTAAGPTPSTSSDDLRSFETNDQSLQSDDRSLQKNATNDSLGTEISSFMQASSTETQGAVETGMWVARFNATDNRSARQKLVRSQVDDLGRKLDTLQEEKQAIIDAYQNGKIDELQYRAQMSGVVSRIQAIQQAVNETEPRARAVGAEVQTVGRLEKRASSAIGPKAAAVAGSVGSVDVPAGNNSTGNGTGVGQGNGNGNGNGVVSGNETDVGPGNGTDVGPGNGTDVGPGNDANGSGNDSEPGNGVGTGDGQGNGGVTLLSTGEEVTVTAVAARPVV